jgi:chorismate mutase
VRNVQACNTGPLDQAAIKRLFERIIDEARHLERIAEAVQLNVQQKDMK